MKKSYSTNEDIADVLTRIADLLEAQDANRFRVNANRRAALVISRLNQDAAALASSNDEEGLEDLPDIGPSIVFQVSYASMSQPAAVVCWGVSKDRYHRKTC